MGQFYYRRLRQVIRFGWKDSKEISRNPDVKKSRLAIYIDILLCYRHYYIFSNQYKQQQVWKLSKKERSAILDTISNENKEKDKWLEIHYNDWNFLDKYRDFKWQKTPEKIKERENAYIKHYGLGKGLHVQYGVTIICEHFSAGKISCGQNVLLARECDIDYTGDLTIEDDVKISEGVKILTHEHDMDLTQRNNLNKGLVRHPLVIHDHAAIGVKAVIMPGVSDIGRHAAISAGAVVRRRVPPYAIVMGNPARVVGFRYPPAIIAEYEEATYKESERIPLEVLEDNYNKYFLSRIKEIQQYLN